MNNKILLVIFQQLLVEMEKYLTVIILQPVQPGSINHEICGWTEMIIYTLLIKMRIG